MHAEQLTIDDPHSLQRNFAQNVLKSTFCFSSVQLKTHNTALLETIVTIRTHSFGLLIGQISLLWNMETYGTHLPHAASGTPKYGENRQIFPKSGLSRVFSQSRKIDSRSCSALFHRTCRRQLWNISVATPGPALSSSGRRTHTTGPYVFPKQTNRTLITSQMPVLIATSRISLVRSWLTFNGGYNLKT